MTTKIKILIAVGLIGLAVVGRLVPHLWNMTPVAAVGLLAGSRMGLGWGIAVPLLAMAITDPILGFAGLSVMAIIYGCFALTGLTGYFLRNSKKVYAILGGSFVSTMIFFFATNAATWRWGTMYPHDFSGLAASYIAGIPFLQNQLIGDLFFTSALFLAWEGANVLVLKLNKKKGSLFARLQ
ncbi:MAG: hypothetical protein HYV68_02775 [Candidatus Taylorbacteria bacterium]|nr:hypothetical protein [Candidatus Taylorbacteria bacterium]